MTSSLNALQSLVQIVVAILLLYIAYTFIVSKQEHSKLFGLGLVFLGLSFASWSANTLLWTNPFIEYKQLAYTLQIASIFTFLGCAVYLCKPRYQRVLNICLLVLASAVALFLLASPYLSGALFYSLRYYLSFADPGTIFFYAVVMSISLVLASFTVPASKAKSANMLDATRVGFIILALSLGLSLTAYDDTIRNINTIVLLVDVCYLAIQHSKTLINKQ